MHLHYHDLYYRYKLSFALSTGADAVNYEELAKTEHLSELEMFVREVHDRVLDIRHEQAYQKQLDGRPAMAIRIKGPGHRVDATAASFPCQLAREQTGGTLFGMSRTVVMPPSAAARVPVAKFSRCGCPGSRRWTWVSIMPAIT